DALNAVFQKLPQVKLDIMDGMLYFSENLDGLETALAGIKTGSDRVFSVKEGEGLFFLVYHVPVKECVFDSGGNVFNIHLLRAIFFGDKLDVMGQRILDVGSRFGHFCNEAKSRGAEFVLGVDLDLEALAEAKKSFMESEKLQFTSDRLEALSAHEKHKGGYDLVTIFLCDGQLCNDQDAAKAIADLVKPGGRVVITSEFMSDKEEAPMAKKFADLITDNGRFLFIRETVDTGHEKFVLYTGYR
ncbi:MAG: class I SAM-dependent methyltransferase, partial [Candidatus Margulisbacteria bacterium]|nr:class I SAM-dependent methyltransferase [Candidatus Margulisiibacteriota bacterium]